MVAFRERKIIFEDKCFGCTDPPTPHPRKKQQQYLGLVRASPAWIFCFALMQLAGSRSSAVMHQMV